MFSFEFIEYNNDGQLKLDGQNNPVKINLSDYDIFCDIKKNRKDWNVIAKADIDIIEENNLILDFGIPPLECGTYHFDLKFKLKNDDLTFAVLSGIIKSKQDVTKL